MIKIEADLIITAEDFCPINNILDKLSLEINNVLVICTEAFFQRWIYSIQEDAGSVELERINELLENDKSFIDTILIYKRKCFDINFIIMKQEEKIINNPIHGEEKYHTGFKVINI